MGKSKAEKKARGKGKLAKFPKKKCCDSKKRCGRCPLLMLKEGTLPEGYTVHRRKLVKVGAKPGKRDGAKRKAA